MSVDDAPIPESCPPAWAHAVGMLDLGPVAPVPTSVAEVADRLLVQETCTRYAHAYDERRLDILEDVFTPDIVFAYTVSGGGNGSMSGRSEVIEWLHDIMKTQPDQRRHVMGNAIVESLTADEADVTAYMSLFSIDTEVRLVTSGFYRMQLVKDGDRWRIKHVLDGLDRPF